MTKRVKVAHFLFLITIALLLCFATSQPLSAQSKDYYFSLVNAVEEAEEAAPVDIREKVLSMRTAPLNS